MRIRSQSRLRYAWAFAIFWNLVSAPATFLGAVPAIQKGQTVAWVALVFPFVGAGLLIWAGQLTLRFWRFGVSWLDLETETAMLGGPLRARIGARHMPEESSVLLTLTCVNRVVTGSGRDRSTWEKVVWQEERTVAREGLEPGPDGEVVPVSFRLPADAPPTRSDNPNDRILWLLEARARLAGVDYDEKFEIPVVTPPPGTALPDAPRDVIAPARSETSRILVEPLPEGGTRFVLPAGRTVGAALGLALFACIFGGGGALFISLVLSGAHGDLFGLFVTAVIGIVLAPVTLLLVAIALFTGFLRTDVTATPAGLTITFHLLGISWTVRATAGEVGDITLKIGMQVGLTAYYDLKIARASGRPLTISANLCDKREAEWLAAEIKKALR
jgi:hypothetical protein